MSDYIEISIQEKITKDDPVAFWNKKFQKMKDCGMYPIEIEFHYLVKEKYFLLSMLKLFFTLEKHTDNEKTKIVSNISKNKTEINGGITRVGISATDHHVFLDESISYGTIRYTNEHDQEFYIYMISTGNIERIVFKRDS